MSRAFFEELVDILIGFLPEEYARPETQVHSRGAKVWFDADNSREHYEAQLIRIDGEICLEIGFHTEHGQEQRNDDVLSQVDKAVKKLGKQTERGDFLGRGGWKRISEVWEGPLDLSDEEVVEAADRLATYITLIEPLRQVP